MSHQDAEPLAAASFALSASLMRRMVATGALSRADARVVIESALFQLRRLYGVAPRANATANATAASDSIDIDALLDAAPESDAEAMLIELLRGIGATSRE